MADNQIPYALDDISGALHPRVKLEFGPDGTVTDVSYAKPLPINVAMRTDAAYVASVSVLPVHVLISASSSSTVTIVAAQTSARVRVLSYLLNAKATTSTTFNSSINPVTGMFELDKYGGVAADFNPFGHFQSLGGQPLTITTGAGAVSGSLLYIPVAYAAEVLITDQSSSHVVSTPSTATAGYRLQNNGIAQRRVSGTYSSISGEWQLTGTNSDYEALATLLSGDTPTGTLGSWISLDTTRTWELSTASGSLTCSLRVDIRKAKNAEILDTATITLTAEST